VSGMLQLRSRWLSWSGLHSARQLRAAVVCAVVLSFLVSAPAQQLWKIDHDTIFIPQDGLALNAHTGALLWRYPRFQGKTVSDGAGLLLVSYLSAINQLMHVRSTRLCRLQTHHGQEVWCREFVELKAWVVDASRHKVYVQRYGHLDVLDAAHGHTMASFRLRDGQGELLALPRGGVLLLDSGPTHTIAALYHPGDTRLQWRELPVYLHPFRGNDGGLLLYASQSDASQSGEFYSPSLQPVYHQPEKQPFPTADAGRQGFVFTDQQDQQPVLRGGAWDGPLWQRTPAAPPEALLIRNNRAVVLEKEGTAAAASPIHLRLLDLSTGALQRLLDMPAGLRIVDGDGRVLLLEDGAHLLLADLQSGTVRWQIEQNAQSALLTSTAVVFWNSQGQLLARARTNGALLWRDQFRFKQHTH